MSSSKEFFCYSDSDHIYYVSFLFSGKKEAYPYCFLEQLILFQGKKEIPIMWQPEYLYLLYFARPHHVFERITDFYIEWQKEAYRPLTNFLTPWFGSDLAGMVASFSELITVSKKNNNTSYIQLPSNYYQFKKIAKGSSHLELPVLPARTFHSFLFGVFSDTFQIVKSQKKTHRNPIQEHEVFDFTAKYPSNSIRLVNFYPEHKILMIGFYRELPFFYQPGYSYEDIQVSDEESSDDPEQEEELSM